MHESVQIVGTRATRRVSSGKRVVCAAAGAEAGFQGGEAEGLEHLPPAADAGVLGLDGGEDLLALGLGQALPGGAELGLAGLVAGGLGAARVLLLALGLGGRLGGLGRRPAASASGVGKSPGAW